MKRLISTTAIVLLLAACDSVEPDMEGAGEQELITSVTLTLTSSDATVTASARDEDGDGSNFEIDELVLTAGVLYSGGIDVRDDVNDESITEEIEEEADEHQFFFIPEGDMAQRLQVTVTDQDSNGLPLGLEFDLQVTPGTTTSGTLRIVLSHFDEEPKNGVDRSSETDIDLVFPVRIQ
jgi:hypothetical protein